MHSLPVFLRLSGRPVILLGDGEAAAAKRVLLERAGAQVQGEAAQASLAIVAIEDETKALAAIARLKARGILVNATDRPDQCDFTLPAIIDRDPVLIAIGTGGASAGLAKALRQRLEALIPQSIGLLAAGLSSARAAMRTRWPDAADRRRAIDVALSPGGALDLFGEAGSANIPSWLNGQETPAIGGLHRFVLSSDDPDHLTLEQARLLGQADMIIHSGVAAEILARGRADALRVHASNAPDRLPTGLIVWLERKDA